MTQTQTFSIQPSGIVRGGTAQYVVDLATGLVTYSAKINLPLWQVKSVSGTYQIDPSEMLSSSLQKVGDKLIIENVCFTVTGLKPGEADVSMAVTGAQVSGSGMLDNSGQYLKVKSVYGVAAVPVIGTLTIQANAVTKALTFKRRLF
jgi:hypothetical protein